jgi:3-deoxy-D-manno-octulosonic-acid transferase
LINGRLSPKSSRNFAKFGNLSKTLFGLFKGIFAQTQSDANEYIKFGVTNYVITGNLKFDAPIDPQQIETGLQWKAKFENRQIIVFASSREGEEELIIKAFLKLKNDKNPILILVPRHLTRMEGIEKFLVNQKITYIKRSTIHNLSEFNQDIIIGDTMGEMAMYLAMADYVIMGGTWMGTGGQNLIEPISLGKPVILGPSTFNFSDISQLAVRAGIAIQTKTQAVDELEEFLVLTMQGFLDFPQKLRDLETQCTEFSKLHQGATLKTLNNLII